MNEREFIRKCKSDKINEREFVKKCKNDIIFFAEHMLRREDGGFYTLEPHQKAMVSSTESQVVYFCGRRLSASLTC